MCCVYYTLYIIGSTLFLDHQLSPVKRSHGAILAND